MAAGVITDTVSVYRLTATGNNQSYGASPIVTGLDCGIFPAGADIQAIYGGEASYALFEIYLYEPHLILNGDKLKSGSNEYIVKGVPEVTDNRYMYNQRIVGEKVV